MKYKFHLIYQLKEKFKHSPHKDNHNKKNKLKDRTLEVSVYEASTPNPSSSWGPGHSSLTRAPCKCAQESTSTDPVPEPLPPKWPLVSAWPDHSHCKHLRSESAERICLTLYCPVHSTYIFFQNQQSPRNRRFHIL